MKPRYKKYIQVIVILLLFLLLPTSLFSYGEEKIDYEIYDDSVESNNWSRPSHFEVKIKNSRIADGLIDGETFEIKDGHNLEKSFIKVKESGDEKTKEIRKYTLIFLLDFDARAWTFTGEYKYEEEITTNSAVPENYLDRYPDGEKNEYIRRTYSGPINGMLTVSENNGFDTGNISFLFPEEPPWPEIFYRHDDGTTTTTKLDSSHSAGIGYIQFDITKIFETLEDGNQNVVVDTDASKSSGETNTSIPVAIAVGMAGTIAAVLGASTAGGGSTAAAANAVTSAISGSTSVDSDVNEKDKSTYKMVIHKDFGDKIRIGDDPVDITARMVEVTSRGVDIERQDMTKMIEIFSSSNILTVSSAVMKGDSMHSKVEVSKSALYGRAAISKGGPKNGMVTFRFTGKGGRFQNKVNFKIIGDSHIKLESDTLSILGTSRESFELEYHLVDFLTQPKVTLKYNEDIDLFKLVLDKNKQGKNIIVATASEKAGKMSFQRFIHRYPVEITAKTDKETVKKKFELHLCYEGIGTAFENCKNNTTPDEIVLECFSDSEKEKRKEKAYRIPLAVMRWNSVAKKLEPDEKLADKLNFKFTADTKSKNLPAADAAKAVKDASILTEVEAVGPSPVKVDFEKKPAVYIIYPSERALAQAPEVEMILTISASSAEFKEMKLKAMLKPQNDYRAMIKWFIEYGKETLADKYLKIGSVSTYHGALDFIEDRIYSESNMPYDPKTTQNHYEDGKYDVFRPNYVYLRDDSLPHKIGEFKKIQSLHHELCHVIEHQNGDTGGDNPERHTYFIQNLSDVIRVLTDMERGKQKLETAVREAIQSYYQVFFNPDNAEPQTFSWFGVTYITQHEMFERYANFDRVSDSTMPDSRKQLIAKSFREKYFPGNLQGQRTQGAIFKENSGSFKGASWTFKCSSIFTGFVDGIILQHPDYNFIAKITPQWVPGTLKIQATYDVESIKTGKTDTLTAELDGGSFNSGDYNYPKVDNFTVTWRATYKISDCIMGQPKVVSQAIKI